VEGEVAELARRAAEDDTLSYRSVFHLGHETKKGNYENMWPYNVLKPEAGLRYPIGELPIPPKISKNNIAMDIHQFLAIYEDFQLPWLPQGNDKNWELQMGLNRLQLYPLAMPHPKLG
jgi:hypothetical protein